jgi:hypothetical protein
MRSPQDDFYLLVVVFFFCSEVMTEFDWDSPYRRIELTQGQYAIVDVNIAEYLNQWNWCYSRGYAVRSQKKQTIKMHTEVLLWLEIDLAEGFLVADHINGNSLDNRSQNLRAATPYENCVNKSFEGLSKHGLAGIAKAGNRWQAKIQIRRKFVHLGVFDTPQEAHQAYKDAVKKHRGYFSRQDHVELIHFEDIPILLRAKTKNALVVPNPEDISSSLIRLSQNKWAIVNNEDVEYISQFKWYCNASGYAVRNGSRSGNKKPVCFWMHREILAYHDFCLGGQQVDHKDRNPLNNRMSNLRATDSSNNTRNRGMQNNNSSGYKGVSQASNGSWKAYITIDRKQKGLGLFDTPEEAAQAYDNASKLIYGDFSCSNYDLGLLDIPPVPQPIKRRLNKANSSGYSGVSFHKGKQKWRAYIVIDGKQKQIGFFFSAEEAAVAYNNYVLEKFGTLARLNSIPSEEKGSQ